MIPYILLIIQRTLLTDIQASETLELYCQMMEDLTVILRKSHKKYGRKLAGFSDRFTPGGLIILNTYGKHWYNVT